MSSEVCMYCGKRKGDISPSSCPKSSNGHHEYTSGAYAAGAGLADAVFPLIVMLFKWFFAKPQRLAGIITRGIIFGAVSFFVACIVAFDIFENRDLSFILGALASIAVFGLYFSHFRKKLDE